MLVAGFWTSQPWEGFNVRSRLWALILRDLPFPFRDIGMELARLIRWVDATVARFWIGLRRSPAWYLVTATGLLAVLLTVLLFSNFAGKNGSTLGQLASRTAKRIPATRAHLEDAGDWAAQDKWRVAHFFVDHRPNRRNTLRPSDVVLTDFSESSPLIAQSSPVRTDPRSRLHPPLRPRPIPEQRFTEADVTLELGAPRTAEVPKRLVDGRLVREAGTAVRPIRMASSLRSRDPELLVQAEWALGTDCESEPIRRPGRRIIPVPDPQWDEIPPPIEVRHPDLSFQLSMLREFLPITGQFPPRSRIDSVSAYSEFPSSFDVSRPVDPLLTEYSPWHKTDANRPEPELPVESYVDRMGAEEDFTPLVDDLDRDLQLNPAPSFAEVALGLEIRAPGSSVAGRVSQSSLVIYNNGLREIPQITVREPLASLETVTDAVPPARVDQFENSLERKIQRLEPGRNTELEVFWRPEEIGRRTHSAIVTVMSAVGALTEVVPPVGEQPMPSIAPEPVPALEPEFEPEPFKEPAPFTEPAPATEPAPVIEPEPAFEPVPLREQNPPPEVHPKVTFDVKALPRVTVDELVEIAIVVQNKGDVPLHQVRVVAKLPAQLKHRQGTEVEYTIASLPVKGTERTILRVVAQSAGQAICQLHVAATEPTSADANAVITVSPRPVAPTVAKAAPPLRPKPATPLPPRPIPVAPSANCCCQSEFMAYDPWFIP